MIRVFDNEGHTFDRYLVIIDDDAFTMSFNATSPQGVNMYMCDANSLNLNWLAKEQTEIKDLNDLPKDVKKAIMQRVED